MSVPREISHDSGNSGILLALPQSDLPNKSTKRSSSSSSSVIRTKPSDLVLFQLPTSEQFQQDLYEGKCQILASNKSASLVSPTTSYKLVTVGTSNTLIVWKDDKNPKGNDLEEDEPSSSPPTKRIKPTSSVTSCRLIQPGGSGASFLVGQTCELKPRDLCQWFEQRHQQHNNVTVADMVSTSILCKLFQASKVEILTALSQIAVIVALQHCGEEQFWQLVSEEEIMLGQRALAELLVEETILEDSNSVLRLEDVAKGISERLLQLLWDQDSKFDPQLGTNEERSLAIARKIAFLTQTNQSKRSYNSKVVHLDHEKVWHQ
jgi:hypothetical protein